MIDLLPTDEQQAVADAVAAFLGREFPPAQVQELNRSGVDARRWRRCADQGCRMPT